MPVAAKFSKGSYDRFGHELADELVSYLNQIDTDYRSSLRELNELDFARFDAKLEQRLAELQGHLRAEFHRKLASIETKLIRWMFLFWAGSALTIQGTTLALAK